jgi:ribosomal protein S1
VLKIGDVIEVYVKEIDAEKKKISLGYRKEEDNPWKAIQQFKIGQEIEVPVVSLTKFGAFVRVLPGIDGLVHISEMAGEKVTDPSAVLKVGDVVKVRLIGVDLEKKRVSLSMRPEGDEMSDKDKREKAFDETLSGAGKLVKDAAIALAEAGDAVLAKAKETAEKATPKVEALGDDIAETAKDLAKKAVPAAKELGEKITDAAKDAGKKIAETTKEVIETVKDKLDGDDEADEEKKD